MLTPEAFREWLQARRQTETLQDVGTSLGVTKQAVYRWIMGQPPPNMALVLAGLLCASPVDLAPGLPIDGE